VKTLKDIRKTFKENGVFYTPPELVEKLKSFIDFKPRRAYDPTCGDGALLACFDDDVEKFGQEIHIGALEEARSRLVNFTGYAGDTLADDGFAGENFDLIIANPPFSVKWDPLTDDHRFSVAPAVPTASRADYAFILHIISHMSDDGVAVVMGFPGILYRSGREGIIRAWMVDSGIIHKVVSIPKDTFVDTGIEACVLILDKRSKAESIEFIDSEGNYSASIVDIKAKNYNLSVSSYKPVIEKDKELSYDERWAIECHARNKFINNIAADLRFSKMVCEIEGFSFDSYIDSIQAEIDKFRDGARTGTARMVKFCQ